MRITYDTEMDAVTFVVTRESVARTVDAGEGRYIDLDDDGNVVAVEIHDVSHGFQVLDLVQQYDLQPLLDALTEYIKTARELLSEGSELHALVG